jgi:mono/diheme cytochrome c family protein
MTEYRSRMIAAVLTVCATLGCRGRTTPPADLMVDAVRADEQEGNLTYAESSGKQLFGRYCETCHGEGGRGDGQNASNLNPSPPDLTTARTDPTLLRRVISEGSAAVGRSPLSPPWARSLTGQEIEYLVAYCQALSRHDK